MKEKNKRNRLEREKLRNKRREHIFEALKYSKRIIIDMLVDEDDTSNSKAEFLQKIQVNLE
jgi:hypothetical protein